MKARHPPGLFVGGAFHRGPTTAQLMPQAKLRAACPKAHHKPASRLQIVAVTAVTHPITRELTAPKTADAL